MKLRVLAGVVFLTTAHVAAAASTHDGKLTPCRIQGVAREVRCGSIQRPENPDAPTGRQISVRYAVVPALARHKASDPVFIFAGGPGQSAIHIAPQVLSTQALLNTQRDLVFVDQRGTGQSNPLTCTNPKPTAPLREVLDTQAQLARMHRCIEALRTQGHDLRQYATWIAVRDIEAVRAALGSEHINVWAASYGTRAALEYLRQFPQRVRSAVLDGVVPPSVVLPQSFAHDNEAALRRLLDACALDARCNAAYPNLGTSLEHLLALAERGLLRLSVVHPVTGEREVVSFDRATLLAAIRAPLYVPTLSANLPHALSRLAAGNANALVALSHAMASQTSEAFAQGMHYAVICAEDMPRLQAAPATGSAWESALSAAYQRVCPLVPVREVPAEFFSIPKAQVPVLLLSGGQDPATPARHGETVQRALSHAQHWVAPHLGHGISAQGCAPELIHRFIRQAGFDGIDPTCLTHIPAPTFFYPPKVSAR